MATLVRLFRATALAASMAAISAYGSLPAAELPARRATTDFSSKRPLNVGPEIADFYRDRGFQPLWVAGSELRPEARQLLALLPADVELRAAVRAAESRELYALTRADLLLTKAFADHVRVIHQAPADDSMHYVDEELRPAVQPLRRQLRRLASATDLGTHLELAMRRNPAFDGLRRGLILYQARWSRLPQHHIASSADRGQLALRLGLPRGEENEISAQLREFQEVHGLSPTGEADSATISALNRGAAYYERLIEQNIERARAIPSRPLGRYILVDTASARLWLIENGHIRDRMRVIVGKVEMPTPVIAGLIRHVVLNPYWNLPPDLIRVRARNAVRRGATTISDERLQVLSDWSEDARTLDPRRVNWSAVASGQADVNLRQLPGAHNMMGAIKFMFPNELGIYLHDTPFREHFARSERRISSGCVRVEDWARLARWMFSGSPPAPSGAPEQEVDLPEPVPVYITYLTALPTRGGVVFQADAYGRDRIRQASARSREGLSTPERPG